MNDSGSVSGTRAGSAGAAGLEPTGAAGEAAAEAAYVPFGGAAAGGSAVAIGVSGLLKRKSRNSSRGVAVSDTRVAAEPNGHRLFGYLDRWGVSITKIT